ncbi:hypothetical protein LLG07_02440 [bacterium]|nr:hypothetical protein [bacterium]
MHRPAGLFKNFEDYLSDEINPEYDEIDTTCKERDLGMGDNENNDN